ncbi:MAG: galactokinase [Lachnospiraceae bacterium]|jgi:galactokinase
MKVSELIEYVTEGKADDCLRPLYVDEKVLFRGRRRICVAALEYIGRFGNGEAALFSSPGRCEIIGNHTDHQEGVAIAAAVNSDMAAVCAPRKDGKIVIVSRGYGKIEIDTNDLKPKRRERGSAASMIRGVSAGLSAAGRQVGGLQAVVYSDIPAGSGLSSSAALQMLIGQMINVFYNDSAIGVTELAEIGRTAEERYFGKACGLLDQLACGIGGLIFIDFAGPSVHEIQGSIENFDCTLCIVNTGSAHANLSKEYSAVPREMFMVAGLLGGRVLRDVAEEDFFARASELRRKVGDRPLLRAYHFFEEMKRVYACEKYISERDGEGFFEVINESGSSSYKYLQNIYAPGTGREPATALAFTEDFIKRHGCTARAACRVHGGGFGGTIEAFIPGELVSEYSRLADALFGEGACRALAVRKTGACRVL